MLLWLFGLAFLAIFSIIDIKKGEISNASIVFYLLFGMVSSNNLLITMLMVSMMFLFGYALWKKNVFGGADAKILSGLPLYFEIANPQDLLLGAILFVVIFAAIGTAYSLIYKVISKKKNIPFVPAIAMAYLIFASIEIVIN